MTTDTAVRVTRTVIQQKGKARKKKKKEMKKHPEVVKTRTLIANTGPFPVPVPLAEIKYVDFPEIRINKHECTEMPFRYMVDDDLMPIMPQVGPSSHLPASNHLQVMIRQHD